MSLSIQFEQTRIILSPTNPKRHDTYHIVRSDSRQYLAKHDLDHTKPTELEYTGVVLGTGKLTDLFTRAIVMPDRKDSETVQAEADRFKLLGHVVRLQILDIFFKSPEAIVGHGGTVALPSHQTSIFHHEAEIAVVVGREAKNLSDDNAMDAVFGYTVFEDISARSGGRPGIVSFLGKSYDTFAGFGPWITTSDEIADPQALHITVDVNGERRQDYSTADMERPIRELMTYLSSVTTLNPGDVICCGTNHQGLGAVQNGDEVITTIDGIGSFTLHVRDDLGREWQRGIDHEMAERVKAMAQNPAHQQNGEQAS